MAFSGSRLRQWYLGHRDNFVMRHETWSNMQERTIMREQKSNAGDSRDLAHE